ncbi:hypothetical protein [Streptomyces sp. NPDC006368]|uniref:hypothetical protein n=1 Tax=Streptomyces sp. NPDC006368 TaxID=3156760 RepID=UPI0033AFBC43
MTAAAVARPGAALRRMREAARRHAPRHHAPHPRALGVALFLGGLLALGILCGGQAYAAERTDPAERTAPAVTAERLGGTAGDTLADPAAAPAAPRLRGVTDTGPHTGAPVTRPATGPATVRDVAEPLHETAGTTAGGVTDEVRRVAGELPAPAGLPGELPGRAPTTPGLPATPQVPAPPAPPALPRPAATGTAGTDDPTGHGAGAHNTGAHNTGAHNTGALGTGARTDGAAEADAAQPRIAVAAVAAWPYAHEGSGFDRTDDAFRPAVALPVSPPAAPEPCGGGACRHSAAGAGDSGSQRSAGDQCAVASAAVPHPAPVRGAGLPATAAPTHDRPHDVLEFPG